MPSTQAHRSRLFSLREDHLYVEENPQIVLPSVPARLRIVPPSVDLEEEEDSEDDEEEDEDHPARPLQIFIGASHLEDEDLPSLDDVNIFPIGTGLPDDDALFDEEELSLSLPPLPPPISLHPHRPRPVRPLASPLPEAQSEGFPLLAVVVAATGMVIVVGMLWM